MKFLALFCFIGFAAAASSSFSALSWQTGEEYVFKYNGRMLTGLPELNTHYSGLGMKCTVHLQVQEQNKFAIQVRDVEYSRVSEELSTGNDGGSPRTGPSTVGGFSGSFEENNWRNLNLPSFAPVSSEAAEYLCSTTLFTIKESGSVEGVTVSKDEPEWTINFKKALVVLFQTKNKESFNLENNAINGIENEIVRSEEEHTKEGSSPIYGSESGYWRTTEESIDGLCMVTYQLNELPKYMTKDINNVIEKSELCPEGKYFELIKNKDINSCSARSSFSYYKPGFYNCPTGNCDGMRSRSSITKYIACGTSRSNLKIMTIINDGELNQDLLGFKTEKFLTGVNQILKLVSKSPISQRYNTPSNPITIPSLMYQYNLAGNIAYPPTDSMVSEDEQYGYGMLEGLTHEEKEKIQDEEIYKFMPKHILTTGSQLSEGAQNVDEKLIPQVKSLLRELVTEDLNKLSNNAPKKQITMKVLSLSRAFSIMSKSGIKSVYEELKSLFSGKEKTIFKNVFFDTVLMGGSVTDVLLIKEWILNGEVTSKVQIASLLTFIPQYVTIPTERVLNELFELIKSEKISAHFALYSHGLLGFTTLVERACVSTNSETSYPTFVYGTFCNSESEIVTGKLIPYLEHELKSTSSTEKKNLIVMSLGLLSHKRVIAILLPVIESTYTTANSGRSGYGLGGVSSETEEIESTGFARYLALYSLAKAGKQYPELVTPVLMSVFLNKGETTEVRVAAFNCILGLEPSTSVLQQIGTSTWSETDMEVLKTINTAFYSLMKVETMEVLSTTSATLCRKVALLYPLIKKTGGSIPTSGTTFSSEYLRQLGVGYTTINSWTSSSESFIPKNVYTKVVYYLNQYQVTPFEFGLRFQGVENIVSILRESASSGRVDSTGEIREQITGELEKIVEQLKIKTRGNQSTQGALYVSFFENMKMFLNFDVISEETLKEKIMPLIRNPERIMEKILGGEGSEFLNFQRVMNLAMTEVLIPSDMGLPIIMETHMPLVFSLNGKLNLESSSLEMPTFNMKVKTLFAAQMTGWVGTICPFTKETLVTAVDEHTVINMPADFSVGLNIPESKLKVVIKSVEDISGPVDMLHYHIRPYTCRQNFWDIKPMTLSANINFIKSESPMVEKTIPFGQEYLGLNLKTVIKTESRFMDKASFFEKLNMYNYNPINMMRFFWASTSLSEQGYPSVRSHEYKIIFEKSDSCTKEIEFIVKLGVATKEVGTSMKYHKIAVVEGKPIVPYKITSESLVSVSGSHSERRVKLEKVLEKLGNLESGTCFTLSYSMVLRGGSRPKTFSYTATFATGANSATSSGMKQKWNLHLESETSGKKMCIRGDVEMPLVPVWKLSEIRSTPFEYRYNNFIGFGTESCEKHTIKVTGNTHTSEEQKRYSKESPEAILLEKLISEGRPVAKLSELAQNVRDQASTLDVVVFHTEYNNIPREVMKINDYAVEFLKALWWPYLEKVEGSSVAPLEFTSTSSTLKMKFQPERQTVDITLHRPSPGNQVVAFKNIRIGSPLSYVLPTVAGKPITKSLVQNIRGVAVYPTCKLEGNFMQTFKNMTVEAKIDNCFHLFAADCGKLKEFAVLVRSLSSVTGPKEIKVLLETAKGSSKSILLTPTNKHSKHSSNIRVTINGGEATLRVGEILSISGPKTHSNPMGVYGKISLSTDGVVRIATSAFELLFNGDKIEVEGSQLFKGKVCGICGDYANVKAADLRGPTKCVYSKTELLIASYRVSTEGQRCSSLTGRIASELKRETEECVRIEVLPTKVLGKFGPYIPVAGSGRGEGVRSSERSYNGEGCMNHRNLIIHEGPKICFSRYPIVACKSSQCRSANMVEKKVSYTCLDNNRSSRHIEHRIESGDIISELKSMPESYKRTQMLPKTCQPW